MSKSIYPHFSAEEFEQCVPPCKWIDMSVKFMNTLEKVRELAGIPFYLNSAFRSAAYENEHGRSGTSMHTFGRAVDIRCNTSQERYKIVDAALKCGIVRIGIGPNFIHLDNGTNNPCVWTYYNK